DEIVIASALSFLPAHALRVAIFVNRPHRIGVETGGDVVVIARFGKVAGGLGFTALLFPASSGATKLARNINEFLNSPANFLEISLHARPAVAENFAGAALIPVDAAGLDHLIKEPTLFAPAAYFSLGLQSHGHVFHLCLMI